MMPPTATATGDFSPSNSRSRARGSGAGGCRKRIGGSSTNTRIKNDGRTSTAKQSATNTTTRVALLSDIQQQRQQQCRDHCSGSPKMMMMMTKNDKKEITTTTRITYLPAAPAKNNNADDSDEDTNSYLLPRTLFQEPSPPPASSNNRELKLKSDCRTNSAEPNKIKKNNQTNYLNELKMRNDDNCSPNEVGAITAVTPLLSASSGTVDNIDDNNINNNHFDDQASILSELSNLSTPSANHRRIIHNSHKLACHILLDNIITTTSATSTSSSSPTITTHKTGSVKNPSAAAAVGTATAAGTATTTTSAMAPVTPTTSKAIAIPLKNDPEFSIYFRMLRYGFTINAVRAALRKDGKLDITRLDPERPVDRQSMPRIVAAAAAVVADADLPPPTMPTTTTTTTGLEIIVNEHGLTDRGWEMALESARKALDDEKTTNNIICALTTATTQNVNKNSSSAADNRKSDNRSRMTTNATVNTASFPSASSSSTTHMRGKRNITTTRNYSNDAAVGNCPPWLLHHKPTPTTTTNAAEHSCGSSNNGVLLEGWLHKRTRHGRWVKRWYLIDSTGIYYTHSPPPSCSSSSSSSFSGSTMIKYIKLVDARYLLLCTRNIRSPTNPMEFELCHHQPLVSSSTSSSVSTSSLASSRKRVLAILKASSVAQVKIWMDAMDCVCERQRLVDEVVVGSTAAAAAVAVVVPEASNTASKSKEEDVKNHNNADTKTNTNICSGEMSHAPAMDDTRVTAKIHTRTQPKLLQSRSTLETLASSSDDSLVVFEESCDGRHNNNSSIPRQHSAMNIDCQFKFNEEFRTDDLMKAVDDLTSLSTPQGGRKSSSELSKQLFNDLKKTKYDSMDVDDNDDKLVRIGTGYETKQDRSKSAADDEPILKFDPKYQKYYAMMKMGLPKEVAQHAMKRDQLDPSILDLHPEKSLRSQLVPKERTCSDLVGLPLKDDPQYSKYFKMLKMGLPRDATKHAMKRDQLDPSMLDLNPEKSLNSQIQGDTCVAKDISVPLKDDPKYAKYFHMMKIGLSKDVAQHAMLRDQVDPHILNLDPGRSLASQSGSGPTAPPPTTAEAGRQLPTGEMCGVKIMKTKPKLRRKKVYWTRVDAREGNIWSAVRELEPTLKHDPTEFERLFAQSVDAETEKVQSVASRSTSPSVQNVKVIDSKRGMNGDIILRKLKLAPDQLASMVENLDCSQLDSGELRTLYEFLPTEEERKGFMRYFENSKLQPTSVVDLTPCEEFMLAMHDLEDSEKKLRSMIFISEFQGKMAELKWDIDHLSAACEELRTSTRFKMLLAMILMIVNKINSSDEDDETIAHGFSLDSLSKLCETKAFDNQTTVLHYLVRVVRESNNDILKFPEDIKSVVLAKNVVIERMVTTVKQLCAESRIVAETAAKYGEVYRSSLEDPHTDSFSNANESVKKFRQMVTFLSTRDVPSGNNNYTDCERFALFSKLELQKALVLIKEANQNYIDLLQYFGEDMKSPQAFFGMIDQFMERFDQVADLLETEEQASRKTARQALAKEAKLRVKLRSADGKNIVNAMKEVVDDRISSGADVRSILRGIPTSNVNYQDCERDQANEDTRPSNITIQTEGSITVPYDEAKASGGVGIRKSSTLARIHKHNTVTDTEPPGDTGVQRSTPTPTTVIDETVDQCQPSIREIFRSPTPIPSVVTKGCTKSLWVQSKVGAHRTTELPFSCLVGTTSIADMAAAAARTRNDPIKLNHDVESTQPVGEVTAHAPAHSLHIHVPAADAAAGKTAVRKELGEDGARLVGDNSKRQTTPKGNGDRNCCADTGYDKYLASFQKKQYPHAERVQKDNVGLEETKHAQEARCPEQGQGKVGVMNTGTRKPILRTNVATPKATPSPAAQTPTNSIFSQATAGARRKDEIERCDWTKNVSTSFGRKSNLNQHLLPRLISPESHTAHPPQGVIHGKSSAMKAHHPSQAHARHAEIVVTKKKIEQGRLQADERPAQPTNPDTNSVTASEQRTRWKVDEVVASPTADNATMAARVVCQKKEKQRSEQNKNDSVCIGVAPGDQTKTWAVENQENAEETCLLLTEKERLKRSLVNEKGEWTNARSFSAAKKLPETSCNNLVTKILCENPPSLPIRSQIQSHQSNLLAAVNQFAKQKVQKPEVERKPSKLSLAVAAAAQNKSSTNKVLLS